MNDLYIYLIGVGVGYLIGSLLSVVITLSILGRKGERL